MQRCSYNKLIQKLNMKIVSKNLKVIVIETHYTDANFKKNNRA